MLWRDRDNETIHWRDRLSPLTDHQRSGDPHRPPEIRTDRQRSAQTARDPLRPPEIRTDRQRSAQTARDPLRPPVSGPGCGVPQLGYGRRLCPDSGARRPLTHRRPDHSALSSGYPLLLAPADRPQGGLPHPLNTPDPQHSCAGGGVSRGGESIRVHRSAAEFSGVQRSRVQRSPVRRS